MLSRQDEERVHQISSKNNIYAKISIERCTKELANICVSMHMKNRGQVEREKDRER